MKFIKLLSTLLVLFGSLSSKCQTIADVYISPNIEYMKTYFGKSQIMLVNSVNEYYSLCNTCAVDEVTVFAGAGGRRWKKVGAAGKIILGTFAELSAISNPQPDAIYMDSDRGGGLWLYSVTNDGLSDGGTKMSNNLVRQYSGGVNLIWFGAKGDGITNDLFVIQSVFDAGYRNVIAPSGNTFFISGNSLFIRNRGVTFTGGGKIKQAASDSLKSIIIDSGAGFTIRDMNIDGHSGAVTGVYNEGRAGVLCYADSLTIDASTIRKQTCIQTINKNYLTITNSKLIYTQMGVHFWGADSAAAHDFKAIGNTITNDDSVSQDDHVRAIRSTNAYNTQIIGNKMLGAQISVELWNHFPFYATNNVVSNNISDTWISCVSGAATVSGNIIDYSMKPVNAAVPRTGGINQICGIEFTHAENVTCTNNYVANVPGMAIYTATPSGTYNIGYVMRGGVIANNVIYRCGDTIPSHFYMANIAIGSGAKDIVISGNLLKETRTSGIGVAGTIDHLVTNVTITNNRIIDGKGDGIWNYLSRNVEITGNVVQNQTGNGIIVGSGKTLKSIVKNNTTLNNGGFGIWIYANSIGHVVTNNTTNGNIGGNLRFINSIGIIGKIFNNEGAQTGHFLPEFGSFDKGDFIPTNSDIYAGFRCTVGGSVGTLAGTTASTTVGSKTITVNDSLKLTEGDYITIAGTTGVYKVQSCAGLTITLNVIVDATVTTASVAYSAPTFINQSFTQFPQYTGMLKPNRTALAVQGSTYIQNDGVNSIEWFKTTPVGGSGGNMGWIEMSPQFFTYGRTMSASLTFNENLVRYSNTFSNAVWTAQNVTPTFDSTIYAPDSTLGAYKLVESVDSSGKLIFYSNVAKPAVNSDYTLSFFAKPNGRDQITAMVSTADLTQFTRVNIDISGKGQIGRFDTTAGFVMKNASAETMDNGWVRVSLTTTIPSTITSFRANIYMDTLLYLTPTAPYRGDGIGGVYLYGVQLSQTNHILPYIETQATTIVRQKIYWKNLLTDPSATTADLAHLSTVETFTGAKTFSAATTFGAAITTGDIAATTDNVNFIGASAKMFQRVWAGIFSSNTQLVLSASNTGINMNVSGLTRATVFTDGNLSIGNSPTNDAVNKLQVNGTVKATGFKVSTLQTAPTSSSDVGTAGETRITASGIYWCIATNSWLKLTGTTF